MARRDLAAVQHSREVGVIRHDTDAQVGIKTKVFKASASRARQTEIREEAHHSGYPVEDLASLAKAVVLEA